MPLEFPSPDLLRARQGSKWSRFPPGILPATPAEGDFAPCPAVDRAVHAWLRRQHFGYPLRSARGPAEALKRAFGHRMQAAFDWTPDPQATLIATSGTQALITCVLAYAAPGEGVVFHTPVFPAIRSAVDLTGRKALPQPMAERQGRFVLGEAALPQGDARMLLLCHPHNPTGRVFDASELEVVARWVERQDIVVISDELHADLMLDGRIHQPFAKLFPALAERTVTLCSPSKAFALGGLGCVMLHFGSPELERRFRGAIPPDLLGEPAVPSLVAAEAAWRQGSTWLRSLTGLVERNRDGFMAEITARAPELLVHRPEATYFLWMDLRRLRARRRPFDLILRKGRVAASDGALYGEGFDGFARVVTATSPERMRELAGRLVMALGA